MVHSKHYHQPSKVLLVTQHVSTGVIQLNNDASVALPSSSARASIAKTPPHTVYNLDRCPSGGGRMDQQTTLVILHRAATAALVPIAIEVASIPRTATRTCIQSAVAAYRVQLVQVHHSQQTLIAKQMVWISRCAGICRGSDRHQPSCSLSNSR